MASTNKMKRAESKKSHSWWWDSHVSPKNSKWLQENLEEMDQYIKRMLKLVEEDADSFSKKAELYFKKRPELITLIEDFYRMYRSLAEKYDHATGELKKRVPSDIQSQGSGISEANSEPPASDQRPTRTKSGPRAAGFDVFLGSRKSSSDLNSSKGEDSSSIDSESESDDSSVNNYSATQSNSDEVEVELRKKIVELEDELRVVKERVELQEKEVSEDCKESGYEVANDTSVLEEKFRLATEKIKQSEAEIARLRDELMNYKSLGEEKDQIFEDNTTTLKNDIEFEESVITPDAEQGLDSTTRIRVLEEELRITKVNLTKSEEEAARIRQNMQEQLKSAQKEVSTWKIKYEKEKREVGRLQDRMSRFKTNLSERDQEIRGLKESISNANKALSEENEQLQAEMTKIAKEKAYLEDSLKELDLTRQSLEEELRRVKLGKAEIEEAFGIQVDQLKADVSEKNNHIEELNKEFDAFKLMYDALEAVKDDLTAKIATLYAEMESKDNHLHELHVQLVELISKTEEAERCSGELRSRVKELEVEVEKKQEIILSGAEEKREAIRQLCFSLEHYRSSYDSLRKAVIAHKRPPVVMAS